MESKIKTIKNLVKSGVIKELGVPLGAGNSGTVYKIFRDYAVKIYKDKHNDLIQVNDGDILKDLEGNNMFPKVFYNNNGEYLIREHVEGVTLEFLSSGLSDGLVDLDIEEFYLGLEDKLIDMVDYCFANNYIPADIREANIIVKNDGEISIIDVGLFEKFSTDVNDENYYSEVLLKIEYNELMNTISELMDYTLVEMMSFYTTEGYDPQLIAFKLQQLQECI